MPTYEITSPDGRRFEVTAPEGASQADVLAYVQQQAGGGSTQAPRQPNVLERPRTDKISPDDLAKDKDWIQANRILYRALEGDDTGVPDEKIHELGLREQALVAWSTMHMAETAVAARKFTPEQKKAMAYAMQAYDRTDSSWTTAGNAAFAVATDPLSWLPIGRMVGGAAKATPIGKFASREALLAFLKKGTSVGVEGAIGAGIQNAITQDIRVTTGQQQEFSGMEALVATGIGFGAGKVIGGAVAVLGGRMAARAEAKMAARAEAKAAERMLTEGAEEIAQREGSEIAAGASRSIEAPARQGGEQLELFPRTAAEEADAAIPKTAQSIIDAVREMSAESGSRIFPRTAAGLAAAGGKAAALIRDLGIETADDVLEVLRRFGFTEEQTVTLKVAVKQASDELAKKLKVAAKENATPEGMDDLVAIQDTVTKLDLALSSPTGLSLGDRVGSFATGSRREIATPELYAKSVGTPLESATPEERAALLKEWADIVDSWEQAAPLEQAARLKKIGEALEIKKIEKAIAKAIKEEDYVKASKLYAEREALIAAAAEEEGEELGKAASAMSKAGRMAAEYITSTVLTFQSITANTLWPAFKTLFTPIEQAILRDWDAPSRKYAAVAYKMMFDHVGASYKAAKIAFAYERTLLTGNMSEFANIDPAIPGKLGGFIRGFLRTLTATDEFFSRLNYRSFISGKTAADAYEAGINAGKTGKALDDYVKAQVEKALKAAYEPEFDSISTIGFLRKEAVRRGYSGDAIDAFVETELKTNGEYFKKATGETGREYVNDLLLKREFSGETHLFPVKALGFKGINVSQMAQGYEKFAREHPLVSKLLGQVFFRTPVRAFEAGFRLSPGLNLITPRFMDDLMGKNGQVRYMRAQGEAMLSYSIGMATMLKYSQGHITGSGPTDYKQRRNLEESVWFYTKDGKAVKWSPYSIRVGDTVYGYRNLDPLATPMKILVNALDRYAELQARKAADEDVGIYENDAIGMLSAGVGAIAQSISDANLTEGVSQLMELGEMFSDPEQSDTAWAKFAGQKIKLVVPGVVQKGRDLANSWLGNETPVNDPVDVTQFTQALLNPAGETIPRQYDVLGNEKTKNYGLMPFLGVDVKGSEDIKPGDKAQVVKDAISTIELATNVKFAFPFKNDKYMKGIDLRTVMTQDGKSTMYDRWAEKYRESGILDILYPLVTSSLPRGNQKHKGELVDQVQKAINEARERAFVQMLSEETGVREHYIRQLHESAATNTGSYDDAFVQTYR